MPMPLSIDDASGTMITTLKQSSFDNHISIKQLLGSTTSTTNATTTLYRMSANKLEPFIRQSPLEIAFYRMSAMDMIRQQYYPSSTSTPLPPTPAAIEDQYSMSSSSIDSSASSVSDATAPSSLPISKSSHKKRSHGLMREIRRLRSENASLHNSVNILKEDLRHERESRQIAEQVHKKYFDDSIDSHTQLEIEILDQQEKILELETRLANATSSSTSTSSSKSTTTAITDFRSPLVFFGDPFDDIDNNHNNNEEECPLWGCEDIDCSNERRCYDETTNDDDTTSNHQRQSIYQLDDNDEEDEDDHDGKDKGDDQFEGLGVSYLRQALVSNLTSARANLEFDDLMLKYDPSPDRVLRTLADAFLGWLRDTIHTSTLSPPTTSSSPIDNDNDNKPEEQEKAICVARLMTTRVQDVFLHFWKAILERYVHNAEDQYQFLHQAERMLQLHHDQGDDATCQDSQYIVQNFHRLLVMFYKYDIIDGDAVTTWWHNTPVLFENEEDDTATTTTNRLYQHDIVTDQLRDVTRKFVEWVDEDDDDEDDDGDDDDDDYDYDNNSIVDDYDDIIDDDNELDLGDVEDGNQLDTDSDYPVTVVPPLIPQPHASSLPEKKKKSVTIQV